MVKVVRTSVFSAIFLPVSWELASRLGVDPVPRTALHKCFPDGRPEVRVSCGYQELEKQACLGQGTCKAELSDASVFLVTGFDHCQADHAQGNHVYEDLLVKTDWGSAMPGGAPEGLLKVAIESLNVPTHVSVHHRDGA